MEMPMRFALLGPQALDDFVPTICAELLAAAEELWRVVVGARADRFPPKISQVVPNEVMVAREDRDEDCSCRGAGRRPRDVLPRRPQRVQSELDGCSSRANSATPRGRRSHWRPRDGPGDSERVPSQRRRRSVVSVLARVSAAEPHAFCRELPRSSRGDLLALPETRPALSHASVVPN